MLCFYLVIKYLKPHILLKDSNFQQDDFATHICFDDFLVIDLLFCKNG